MAHAPQLSNYNELEEKQEELVAPGKGNRTYFIWFMLSALVGIVFLFVYGQKWQQTANQPPALTPSISPIQDMQSWLMFTDQATGIRLRYPNSISLNQDEHTSSHHLTVAIEPLASIPEDLPLGMGRGEALDDKKRLEKGVAQTIGDFAASDALVKIGPSLYGRITSVLSRFEVCSVLFERTLVFYPGDYRVRVTLSGNVEAIQKSMPEFFVTDQKNCGTQLVWNREKRDEFLPMLAKGEGKGEGQEWYDTFLGIIKTITYPAYTSTPTPTLSITCEVEERSFCPDLEIIKRAMVTENYALLLEHQIPTTITCDPAGMAMPICEGEKKGTTKKGYSIGYYQSEGVLQSEHDHISTISQYVADHGPFTYKGSIQKGDRGMVVYASPDNTFILAFPMKQLHDEWKFQTVLLGETFPDNDFVKLSPSLLQSF